MEEIIIDGVDVAGCEYMLNNKIKGKQHCPVKAMPYAKETSCICRKSIDTPYNFCKHNPNCHYKQLKRLEQENFELKESLKCFQTPEAIKALTFYKTGEFELQEKKYIKLEQENADLKKYIERIDEPELQVIDAKIALENANLKEEIGIRDNLSEKFRKEALSWANIANGYQKDKTKLKQTLQEIKAIAIHEIKELTDSAINGGRYLEILDLITKAEEE